MNTDLAQLACIFEATARKVGNVHPQRDFASTTYFDFIVSASCFHRLTSSRLGEGIHQCVAATREQTATNTNLGMILLLVPLLQSDSIVHALAATTVEDAHWLYRAIRLANPGGLGTASEQDVDHQPTIPLLGVMKLAADRDLIARQYANNFADVFSLGVPALVEGFQRFHCLEAAVIHCHLSWLAAFPDSLIARKCGLAVTEDVHRRVQAMMALGGIATAEGRAAGRALDAHLRSDGNRLNPGTSADLVAACLFVALREGKLKLNAPFQWQVEDWL